VNLEVATGSASTGAGGATGAGGGGGARLGRENSEQALRQVAMSATDPARRKTEANVMIGDYDIGRRPRDMRSRHARHTAHLRSSSWLERSRRPKSLPAILAK
jgi:hypothetical protein